MLPFSNLDQTKEIARSYKIRQRDEKNQEDGMIRKWEQLLLNL